FRAQGEAGLLDGREDNGELKLDERYLDILYRVVRSSPKKHGWRRPTWTRELLVATLAPRTRVRVPRAPLNPAPARVRAPPRRLPVPGGREKAARARDPLVVGHAAPPARGRLRGRGGHPPQPEDRPGLDGAWPAEGGAHPRAERQALPGRRPGRADGAADLGG